MQANTFSKNRIWINLIIGFSLVLFFSELLEKSMFIDGVWYAVISRNLAEGNGSFWFPQFSQTIFSSFHEHPGFVFWLQSFFFKIFGDTFWTERIFSGIQYIITGILIYKIWGILFPKPRKLRNYWFLPILFWQFNIVTYLYQPGNLLDTPLSIFCLVAVYYFIREYRERKRKYLIFAGLAICLAMLSKGLVALFPIVSIGCFWLIFSRRNFIKQVLNKTMIVTGTIAIFFLLLFLIIPSAWESTKLYIDVQLLASLKGERRLYYYQDNRFFIIGQLVFTLLPMILVWISLILIKRLIDFKLRLTEERNQKLALLFLIVGATASLPLMISPRQALPYLIPSLPYYAIGFGILAAPFLDFFISKVIDRIKWLRRTFEWGSLSLIVLGVLMVYTSFQKSNQRDADTINDAQLIGQEVGTDQIISSSVYDMYISGYLMRYHSVSIDTSNLNKDYLITTEPITAPESPYQIVPIKTKKYLLYQKVSSNQFSNVIKNK